MSRVWPILVRNSLNFDSPLFVPCSEKKFGYLRGSSRRIIKKSNGCRTWTSDIFCVTGGITAIIGSLIASFGIFPKNQARIRLYLECVGCAMVIIGIMIVLISLRMRTKTHEHLDSVIWHSFDSKYDSPRDDHHHHRQQPRSSMATSTTNRFSKKFHGFKQSLDLVQPEQQQQQLANQPAQQPSTSTSSSSGGLDESANVANVEIIPEMENNKNNNNNSPSLKKLTNFQKLKNVGGSLDNRSPTFFETIDSEHWNPDFAFEDDEAHKQAIETALSTVLTVSTLVGFRAERANKSNYCCLHHTVQNKLSALKWIKKMRALPSTSGGRELPEAPNQGVAETTLVETNKNQSIGEEL